MSDFSSFEREQYIRIIDKLISKDYCKVFLKLDINGSESWHKEYLKVIPRPMDLLTVRNDLQNNVYRSASEFQSAVDLIWTNAIDFNGSSSCFAALALEGQTKFRKSFAKVCKTREEEWLRKLIKTSRLLKEKASKLSKQVLREAKKEAERIAGET
jgi:hypothetical protein